MKTMELSLGEKQVILNLRRGKNKSEALHKHKAHTQKKQTSPQGTNWKARLQKVLKFYGSMRPK